MAGIPDGRTDPEDADFLEGGAGVELYYTGHQELEDDPYRSVSQPVENPTSAAYDQCRARPNENAAARPAPNVTPPAGPEAPTP